MTNVILKEQNQIRGRDEGQRVGEGESEQSRVMQKKFQSVGAAKKIGERERGSSLRKCA